MPDTFNPEFDHALEADMQRLAKEVLTHREKREVSPEEGKEILKESIKRLYPLHSGEGNAGTKTAPQSSLIPAYADEASPEVKLEIEYLVDVAFHHGVAKANAAAKNAPPFVLDAFHDALAGKLYHEFEKRGLLK